MRKIRFLSVFVLLVLLLEVSPGFGAELSGALPLSAISSPSVEKIDAGPERENAVRSALADFRVVALRSFLETQGYEVLAEQSTVTRMEWIDFDAKFIVTIIPCVTGSKREKLTAHIAFWQGTWKGKRQEGVVAAKTLEQDRLVYIVHGKDVEAVARARWQEQLEIPLNAITGPIPNLAPVVEKVAHSQPRSLCTTADVARTHYTLLGFVAYRFHQYKYWCYTGSRVYSVSIGTYMSNVDSNFVYRGIIGQWDIYPPNQSYHDSMRQAQVDNCIFHYGCIGSSYPAVWIRALPEGGYYSDTWE